MDADTRKKADAILDGTLLIDLPAALHASGRFDQCWFAMDEVGGHPNAVGHRLMGETIAAALEEYLRLHRQ